MSRVAILCPGPSLRRTWSESLRSDYHVVIGVNHACGAFRVDWLCAGDLANVFANLRAMPTHGVITPANVHHSLITGEGSELWNEGHPPWNPAPWLHKSLLAWEHLRLANATTPCNYSAVAALAAAVDFYQHDCPAVVDVYGADMRGTDGVDGIGGENRSGVRWQTERIDLAAVAALAPHAVIRRITPYPPE